MYNVLMMMIITIIRKQIQEPPHFKTFDKKTNDSNYLNYCIIVVGLIYESLYFHENMTKNRTSFLYVHVECHILTIYFIHL